MKSLLERDGVLDAAALLLDRQSFSTSLGRGEAMEMTLPFGLLTQALDGLGGRDVLGTRDAVNEPAGPSGNDLRARF